MQHQTLEDGEELLLASSLHTVDSAININAQLGGIVKTSIVPVNSRKELSG